MVGAGEAVRVYAAVEADVESRCALCLEPVTKHLKADIDALFAREPDPEDPDQYPLDGYRIDVTDLAREALLLELVKRMFSGQFALAGQHSGEQDPVLLYAVETALQLHIAELTEPLRELYVMAYSLPSIAAYLYKSTTKRLQVIFGPYLPEAQPKDFYEMEIASASIMRGFMSVPCDVYFTMDAKISRFLDCSLKLYDVPKEKRAAITAAVLQMDLHTMALGIIQKTVQQAEKGFEALTEKQI